MPGCLTHFCLQEGRQPSYPYQFFLPVSLSMSPSFLPWVTRFFSLLILYGVFLFPSRLRLKVPVWLLRLRMILSSALIWLFKQWSNTFKLPWYRGLFDERDYISFYSDHLVGVTQRLDGILAKLRVALPDAWIQNVKHTLRFALFSSSYFSWNCFRHE
jgi:hypothetical protein